MESRKKRIRNKINCIFFSVLMVAFVTLVSGCQPDTKKMLISYMNNRYPDGNFTVDHYDFVSYDREYYITEVYFSNSSFPDGDIRAHIMRQNGQWVYQDNYMMLSKKNEMEEHMQRVAEEKFGACKVYVHFANMFLPSDFPVTADADEVLDNSHVELIIYLPPSDTEVSEYKTQTDDFWKELLSGGHARVFGTVWSIDSQSVYDSLTAPFTSVEMDQHKNVSKKVGSFGQFPY